MRTLVSALVLMLCAAAFAEDHAVILLYHHVSDDTPPSTSISPARFSAHLEYLSDHQFKVVALEEIIARLRSGHPLPENAVAITFDDGYQSVLTHAAPELKRRNFPFTVFVNPSYVKNGGIYLNWQELREIQALGGNVQNHGYRHTRLAFPARGETPNHWKERAVEEITRGQREIAQHLGQQSTLFAYPYGEFSPELAQLVIDLGLTGLGQQSGAVGYLSNLGGLPRHPFYTGADHIERFAERINTRPLLISPRPEGPLQVSYDARIPLHLNQVMPGTQCFFDGRPISDLIPSQPQVQRYELGPFPKRRTKLNCTRPDANGNFYWWSYLFIREEP